MRDQDDDVLSAVFAEVIALTAAPGPSPGRRYRAALEAYFAAAAVPPAEPAARAAVAALVPCVLRDAAAAREAMRDDPAAAGLAAWYGRLLAELGAFAAVFAEGAGPGGDGGPPHADEYLAVCAEVRALMDASEEVKPIWEVMRSSRAAYAASRAAPPRAARDLPRAPLADDREYYA